LPGQLPGEQFGLGAPPSANDVVETAPTSSKAASNKRAIFFMKSPLVEIVPLWGHHSGSRGATSEVFENHAI